MAHRKFLNTPAVIAVLYLLGSLVIAYLESERIRAFNRHQVATALVSAGAELEEGFTQHLYRYQYGLRGVRGVVLATTEGLNLSEFKRYSASRDIDSEFAGARGFGFIRRVPMEQQAEFLETVAREGYADFRIRQLQPHDGERFIIEYIEPVERNREAVGLDIASERNRREAALDALRSGEIRLTAPITLVQAAGQALQSFLILMPVYNTGVTPATEAERLRQGIGWAYAPLVMNEVMDGFLWNRDAIHLDLYDVTDAADQIQVYASDSTGEKADDSRHIVSLTAYGRNWHLEITARPGFVDSLGLWKPAWTLQAGLLFAILISLSIWALLNGRTFKREAREQRDRVMALVESSSDAIIFCDLEGQITAWNHGAETLFGYTEAEVRGRNLSKLILPEDLRQEERDILDRIAAGETVSHFPSRRLCKDSSEREVSIAVVPILKQQQVVGYAKTIRDVSEEMAAQRQIVALNRNLEAQVEQRTAELARSEKNLQGILDNMPSRVAYWDADKNLVVANRGVLGQLLIKTHDAFGKHLTELVDAKGVRRLERFFSEALKTRKPVSEEMRVEVGGKPYNLLTIISPQVEDNEVKGFYTISSDVTEIRQNQAKLEAVMRENEALLATINEQMLYSVTDARGIIIDANDNFCRSSGYERDELIGQSHAILNSRQHPKRFWRDMWRIVASGLPWRGDICNRSKDGSLRWFDTVIAPFKGSDGHLERYVALRTDITEKRRAEEEKNRVNALLTDVLNASSEVSIIASDPEGVITIFNTGAEIMLGYRAEDMVGKQTPAIIHREDEVVSRGLEMTEQYGEDIAGFEVFVYVARREGFERRQWTYVRKDGSELRVSLVFTAMYNDDGEVVGYLGVAIDISAEEKSRRSLIHARDQLSIAADVADMGVWSFSNLTRELEWNERMYEIHGLPPDQPVTDEQWKACIFEEDLHAAEQLIIDSLREYNEYQYTCRVRRPSGEVRWVSIGAQAERSDTGELLQTTGICRDITEQLTLENELRRAKELADSSNAAKSAFLANMSHEIRTPMNAVLGMLQLVKNTPLSIRQADYINKADIAAKALLDLLNDLLDFSKIEAGKLSLEEEAFDVDVLMQDVGVILGGYQHKQSVELIFDIDPSLPLQVVGDPLRLKQVLLNLGGNALKFTESGYVVVRLKKLKGTDATVSVRIEVEDSGIGISEAHLERIFDDFTQAESSTARRFGGTGLGLVISRRLVVMMGGELLVDSEVDVGSTFSFELALNVVDSTPLVSNTNSGRVLLAESNNVAAATLRDTLASMGYDVQRVRSGAEAVELVGETGDQHQGFDVAILGSWLPDISGKQTAEFVANSPVNVRPRIILLAPPRGEAIETRGLAEGSHIDCLLTRPPTPQQLQQAINRLMHGGIAAPAATTHESKAKPLQGLRLLIVEDNELNRQVAEELLSDEGAIVDLADGGVEGVRKVLEGRNNYDLIVMDMQMPDIDGLEATRRIRAAEGFVDLPILAMTANASVADRELCLAAGMNEHIGKPIDMAEVVPCILRLVGKSEGTEKRSKVRLSSNSVEEEVQKRFGGNMKMFCRVQPKFEATVQQLLADLDRALEQLDLNLALATLHSMKGTCGTMGARALSEFCADLEKQVKVGGKSHWRSALNSYALSRLRELAAASVDAMQALYDELNGGTEASEPAVSLTQDELRHQLNEMEPLLKADNLRVLDFVELIQAQAAGEYRTQLAPLIAQINALDFASALKTLDTLKRELL